VKSVGGCLAPTHGNSHPSALAVSLSSNFLHIRCMARIPYVQAYMQTIRGPFTVHFEASGLPDLQSGLTSLESKITC
jgi:hypothetical protein